MRTFLVAASASLAAVVLAPPERAFAGDQLTITSYGGAAQAAERKAYFEPFSKATGIKITEDEYNGETSKVRAMVESKSVSWDVVSTGRQPRKCAPRGSSRGSTGRSWASTGPSSLGATR